MKDFKLFERLLSHLIVYSCKLASSVYGWAIIAIGSIASFFATEKYAFVAVLCAIILDALFAIISAVRLGKFILSKLGRVTLFKISAYGAALVFSFLIEKLAHDDGFIAVKIAAAWAIACEFWSMSASILIVWPDAVFFRIMRRHLKGEIAAKLGAPIDDILVEEKKV